MITVIVTLFLLSTIVMLLVYDSASNARSASSDLEAARVEYVAEAAMKHALWQAQNSQCKGVADIPDTYLGDDSYSVKMSGVDPGTVYQFSADQDAWIRNDDTDRNNGTGGTNHLRFETGKIEQILTRFDLTGLPSGAKVLAATAWFYIPGTKMHPEGAVTAHEITSSWEEKSVTWDSFASAYRSSAAGTIPAQAVGDKWVTVNLTGQVRSWANGQPNNGILLNSVAEGLHAEYYAREDGAHPPRLEVVIATGSFTPVTIKAKGQLASGVSRNLKDRLAATYQPPSIATLQLGAVSGADANLDNFYAKNYGGSEFMQVNENTGNWLQRPVVRFDLGALPDDVMIQSATLELWVRDVQSAGSASVHEVTRSWVEGTQDGGGQNDGATWATYDGANNWSTPGGEFVEDPVATTEIVSANRWATWDITPLVQKWLSGAPNHGVLLKGDATLREVEFKSREAPEAELRPRLTVTYSCECGTPCMPLQSAGRIALIGDDWTPDPDDQFKIQLLESWGYDVDFYQDRDSGGINWSNYDLAYVSETAIAGDVHANLESLSIGVVNEEPNLYDDLKMASGNTENVGGSIEIVDNSHFITSVFPVGALSIYSGDMEILTASAPLAGGLQTLGEFGGQTTLAALDRGAVTTSGTAAGRRVILPLGQHFAAGFDWQHLNYNGHLLVQRSIDWAIGVENKGNSTGILLVVGNASNPSSDDAARQTLIESWGMTVTLIDDGADDLKFKSEMANIDVVYVSGSASPTGFLPSLAALPTPIVNEQIALHDELGFSSSSGSNAFDKIFVENNSHSITTGFSTGWLTIATSSQTLYSLEGTLAPGMNTLATTWINGANYKDGLALLESGASLYNGGSAAARRAQLPWGAGGFNFANLNANGQLIMQRAIEWAAGPEADLSPLAHWKLDETGGTIAVDSVGGHDGTTSNTEWVPGVDGGALRFNSNSDSVLVPHADELSLTNELTIAAWINKAQLWGYDGGVVKATTGSDLNYLFGTWEQNPVFGFSTATDNWQGYYATGTTLSTNTWYHMATTFNNAADRVRIYIDGTLAQEFSTTLEPVTNSGNLMLGRTAIGEYWPGLLDDVRLYDRELSADEIAELAQPPSAVPVAHWQLDENTGLTTVDSLGGRVGTLANGASWAGGALGSGVRFDGSNDRINVLHDDGLNLVSEMTLSAWIYADALKPFQMVLTKGDNGVAENYWLATEGNKLNFGFIDSGLYAQYTSSSLTLEAGRWHHVAATFDNAADEVVLYVDGTPETFSSTYTPAANNEQLIIGSSYYGGEAFDGVIDDVRIYNSVLGAQEISDLAASGGGGGGSGGGGGGGGASYVEKNHVFTVSANNSWQTLDLSSQGVLPNAVVEIAMENTKTNAQREAGVRAVGGSGPTYDLHEPEGGGVDALTKHVQTDGSGQIQAFAENSAEVQFRLLGYWTGGTYSNTDGLFTSSTGNSWRLHNMTSFGIQPEQVVELIVQNTSGGAEYRGGVRNVGSGHAQILDLHEAEAGGKDFHSVFVRTANNVSAAIEAYAENTGSIEFKPAGMWTTPPGTYTQHDATVDLGRPTANNTWQTVDLAPFGVPPNAVVQITLANRNPSGERRMGVRAVGSSLARYVDLHEAEGGGEDLVTMHVKADASSRIQWYHERPADSHRFYLMGWWVLD